MGRRGQKWNKSFGRKDVEGSEGIGTESKGRLLLTGKEAAPNFYTRNKGEVGEGGVRETSPALRKLQRGIWHLQGSREAREELAARAPVNRAYPY